MDEVYVSIVDGYLSVIIGDYLLCLDIHPMKYLNRIETLGDMIHMIQNKTLSCGFPNEVLSIEYEGCYFGIIMLLTLDTIANGNQSFSGNYGALESKLHVKIDIILMKLRNIDIVFIFILLVVAILVFFWGLILVVMATIIFSATKLII